MIKRHIPYFSFYPADFMNGVRGMSAQEVGTYTMLLCRIYEENGPVEYHVMRLATYCGMRAATFEKTVEKLVDLGKLSLADGWLSNRRADDEIAKRLHDLENSSKAGLASAEKRKQNQQEKPTGVKRAFNHTDTDTEEERKKTSSSSQRVKFFDAFWDAYPHRGGAKKGRASAVKSYERAVKSGVDEATIIEGAARYATDRRVIDGFAKDPATWLNQSCWQDEIEVQRQQSANKNSVPSYGDRRQLPDGSWQSYDTFNGWIKSHV